MHQAEQNTDYQETLRLSKITPQDSLYVTEGGLPGYTCYISQAEPLGTRVLLNLRNWRKRSK